MSEIWYKRHSGTQEIEEVVAESSSEHFLKIKGGLDQVVRREKKDTYWSKCYRTKEEAVAHGLSILINQVGGQKSALETAKSELANFKKKHGVE